MERRWLEVLVGRWNTEHWLRLFVNNNHGLRYLKREDDELRWADALGAMSGLDK